MDPVSIQITINTVFNTSHTLSKFILDVGAAPQELLALKKDLDVIGGILWQVQVSPASEAYKAKTYWTRIQSLQDVLEQIQALLKTFLRSDGQEQIIRKLIKKKYDGTIRSIRRRLRVNLTPGDLLDVDALGPVDSVRMDQALCSTHIAKLEKAVILPAPASKGIISLSANNDDDTSPPYHSSRNSKHFYTSLAFYSDDMGWFFVGYTLCHCSRPADSTFGPRVRWSIYHFPPGTPAPGVYTVSPLGYFSGLELNAPRIVPGDSTSFVFTVQGSVRGLKTLFRNGMASPFDVDTANNTLLLRAAQAGRTEVCRFLITQGVDPYLENDHNNCAADIAWDRSIIGRADSGLTDIFMPYRDIMYSRGFSPLHRAVLGLASAERANLIRSNTQEIDSLDYNARTPLYWAVRKGDLDSVRTLLIHGANPNVGFSSITWACCLPSRDPSILRLLLESGANTESTDVNGHTALHVCGIFGRGSDFIQPLLDHHALLDQPHDGAANEYRGITAIGFACLYQHPSSVRTLLNAGADVHVRDHKSRTLLHLAMLHGYDKQQASNSNPSNCKRNVFSIVQMLVTSGADVTTKDDQNLSALDICTLRQDMETLDLLISATASINHPPSASKWKESDYRQPGRSKHRSDEVDYNTMRSPSPLAGLGDNMLHEILYNDPKLALMSWHNWEVEQTCFSGYESEDSGYYSNASVRSGSTRDPKDVIDMQRQKLHLPPPEHLAIFYQEDIEHKTPGPTPLGTFNDNTAPKGIARLPNSSRQRRCILLHTAIKKVCAKAFRPRLQPGYVRIVWECYCGTELYGDYLDNSESAIPDFAKSLNGQIQRRGSSPTSGSSGTSSSSLSPASSSPTSKSPTTDDLQSLPGPAAAPGSSLQSATQSPSSQNQMEPSFLELCINTGNLCQTLGEIDATRITTDTMMFHYIKQRYKEVRGFRNTRHWLMKPVRIRYVQFALEEQKKVHICNSEADSFPTDEEIRAKRWHPPLPPPQMPSNAFIHHVFRCKVEPSMGRGPGKWVHRLPKKRREPLKNSSEPLQFAWGVHIIEGPDMALVFWVLICVLALCLGPFVAYLVIKKDVQGTAGIASLAVSILTLLWMCMKVNEWKNG